jgi:small subunit ribosomal protein S5
MSNAVPREDQLAVEKVIQIDRINKVVKGGKRLQFRAFTIVGDLDGKVGFALGKSKEVPSAIKKGIDKARKYMEPITITGGTIPHEVVGAFGSARVLIKPAKPGTGVIAGGAVRILLEACGMRDVVAKILGKGSSINNVKAAMDGLMQLKNLEEEQELRGKTLPVYIREADQEMLDALKQEDERRNLRRKQEEERRLAAKNAHRRKRRPDNRRDHRGSHSPRSNSTASAAPTTKGAAPDASKVVGSGSDAPKKESNNG